MVFSYSYLHLRTCPIWKINTQTNTHRLGRCDERIKLNRTIGFICRVLRAREVIATSSTNQKQKTKIFKQIQGYTMKMVDAMLVVKCHTHTHKHINQKNLTRQLNGMNSNEMSL